MQREKEMATHSSILAWRILWTEEPGGLLSMGLHRIGHNWSDLACMHALEKEMATHSSILAWRIPGTEEPGELLCMELHRVGHNWNDLATAAGVDAERWTWRPFRVPSSKAGVIDIFRRLFHLLWFQNLAVYYSLSLLCLYEPLVLPESSGIFRANILSKDLIECKFFRKQTAVSLPLGNSHFKIVFR